MLSQAVGYAATAMAYVAAAGGNLVLVKEIADATGIPGPYLAKIVNTLARKGLVLTQRGIGGGVSLAKPAQDISLFDVCVALDDPVVQVRCMLGTAPCSDERSCPAHKFWKAQREKVVAYCRDLTVADVAAFETKRRWKVEPPHVHGQTGGPDR
jgi:Rrf2 family protein